ALAAAIASDHTKRLSSPNGKVEIVEHLFSRVAEQSPGNPETQSDSRKQDERRVHFLLHHDPRVLAVKAFEYGRGADSHQDAGREDDQQGADVRRLVPKQHAA